MSVVLGMFLLILGLIVFFLVGINEIIVILMVVILFSMVFLGFVVFFMLIKNKKEIEKCEVNEFKMEVFL